MHNISSMMNNQNYLLFQFAKKNFKKFFTKLDRKIFPTKNFFNRNYFFARDEGALW